MARKSAKMSMSSDHVHGLHCMMCCCTSWGGLTHAAAGAGLALLIVSYFSVPNLIFWGWVLVGAAVIGHVVMMKK